MFSGCAFRSILFAAALTAAVATTARAQTAVPHVAEVSLSGPRFGMTFLGQGIIDKLADHDIKVGPMITPVRLAVREAPVHGFERPYGIERVGPAGRGSRPRRGAPEFELDGGPSNQGRR